MAVLAVDTTDLHPAGTLDLSGVLWTAVGAGLAVAAACIVLVILLSRRRRPHTMRNKPAQAAPGSRQEWLARVNDVKRRHDDGRIDDEEAYGELAALARSFASAQSGCPLANHTLTDLERMPRTGHVEDWDSLRMTIAALYPAEFAAPANGRASVDTAVGWVAGLVERWH